LTGQAFAAKPVKYLTAEDAAIAEAKRWQNSGQARPFMSDDGMVLYPFGQYLPTMVCSTLRACDIQLEPGEQVVDKPKTGDNARWIIGKMVSGPSDAEIVHIIVKPKAEAIDTNLIIPTDRRVYHIKLKAAAKEGGDFVHRMGFYYPEDMVAKWGRDSAKEKRKAEEKEKGKVSELGDISLGDLDFGFNMEGDAPFRPSRVFTNGVKTYIQMPASVRSSEMPVLVVLDEQDKPLMVNYRIVPPKCLPDCATTQGDLFVVDQVIRKAMLVLGSDDTTVKVTIARNGVPVSRKLGGLFSGIFGN
jgi:type IV secretion system protein VirB9